MKNYFGQETPKKAELYSDSCIIFTFRKIKLLYKQNQKHPNKEAPQKKKTHLFLKFSSHKLSLCMPLQPFTTHGAAAVIDTISFLVAWTGLKNTQSEYYGYLAH